MKLSTVESLFGTFQEYEKETNTSGKLERFQNLFPKKVFENSSHQRTLGKEVNIWNKE